MLEKQQFRTPFNVICSLNKYFSSMICIRCQNSLYEFQFFFRYSLSYEKFICLNFFSRVILIYKISRTSITVDNVIKSFPRATIDEKVHHTALIKILFFSIVKHVFLLLTSSSSWDFHEEIRALWFSILIVSCFEEFTTFPY